ncbi:MAG: sugar phosphate nucleotidyltransferase, partial [Eubacteriales bacterium]
HYIDEDKPLGTGGGLSLIKGKIQKTSIVSNCDILIDANYADIYKVHKASGNLITMVCAFKHIVVPYGVINTGEGGAILSMEEKPAFSFMVNTGMYLIEPRVIEEMPQDTEVGFPDIVEKYRLAGEKVAVYPINEKDWMDMGQIEELEEMRIRMGV